MHPAGSPTAGSYGTLDLVPAYGDATYPCTANVEDSAFTYQTVNGAVTRAVYDQEDMLVEYDAANVPQARYTHGPGIDEPLARTDGTSGQTVYYHADGLGSITELTDGTGGVV